MTEKYLREREFNTWKDNHWDTHCVSQAKFEGKTSSSLKWLTRVSWGAFVLLLGLLAKSFF